jgi:hypothetical protein
LLVIVDEDVTLAGLEKVTAWVLPCADVVAELVEPLLEPPLLVVWAVAAAQAVSSTQKISFFIFSSPWMTGEGRRPSP